MTTSLRHPQNALSEGTQRFWRRGAARSNAASQFPLWVRAMMSAGQHPAGLVGQLVLRVRLGQSERLRR